MYISSLSKGKASKPSSRYRYKAETGAYIEASRKETFSVCPEKGTDGTWISGHSVALNAENCLSVLAPDLAGTFRLLFAESGGRTDTIQVLVEQSYIQMGDYSHRIWVPDSMPSICSRDQCSNFPAYGHYENRSYSQPLIVDKTKLTAGDAWHYFSNSNMRTRFSNNYYTMPFLGSMELEEYPKNGKFEGSRLPYIKRTDQYVGWKYANERSKEEGLDTAYRIIAKSSYKGENAAKFMILGKGDEDNYFVVDTSSRGYKLPSKEEWMFLMRSGASTKYYWGDEEDSLAVSRHVWVRPIGLKPVAQRPPNGFGLYDMVGLTHYEVVEYYESRDFGGRYETVYQGRKILYEGRDYSDFGMSCSGSDQYGRSTSPECYFIKKMGSMRQAMRLPTYTKTCMTFGDGDSFREECEIFDKPVLTTWAADYYSFRLLRKTPKLHKLEKF
jgi:hypothetical protein